MKRSLRWRLSVLLGSAVLAAAIAAAVAAFLLAYREAQELQDDTLRQIALLAARGQRAPASAAPGAQNPGDLLDPESRVSVYLLPDRARPAWLTADLQPGFHTLAAQGERLRVFLQGDARGTAIVVAQSTETRDEIALTSALQTLVPLILLLPVITWLIARIVQGELAPVAALARHLDAQPADRPRPLPAADVPDEIAPFVHAIDRLLARVRELVEQQRRFVADAAHELRSPLTALSVQAQNLQQARSLADMRERIAPLQAGIERARKLVEQLLSLARTQSTADEADAIDLSEMAREIMAEFLPLAAAKGIDLGLDEAQRLTLLAAPERLRLLLRNVLDNALKYAPAGGEVTIRLHADGADALIDVVDNGPGIPPEARERVFDPFYRMPAAAGDGSGLGLAIAHEAASRLHGSLTLLDPPHGPGLLVRYRQRRGV